MSFSVTIQIYGKQHQYGESENTPLPGLNIEIQEFFTVVCFDEKG
jgi:hypothetical protein